MCSRYFALAIILITLFCSKNTGNVLDEYVLPKPLHNITCMEGRKSYDVNNEHLYLRFDSLCI